MDAAARTHHRSLSHPPANLIGGRWVPIEGDSLVSTNPARPDEIVWSGSPDVRAVDEAVASARTAFGQWSAWPRERRFDALGRYRDLCAARVADIAPLISRGLAQVPWDAAAEAGPLAVAGRVFGL